MEIDPYYLTAISGAIGVGIGGEFARSKRKKHEEKVRLLGAEAAGPAPNFLKFYLIFLALCIGYAVYLPLSSLIGQ